MLVASLLYATYVLELILKRVLVNNLHEDLGEVMVFWADTISTLTRQLIWPD